MMMWTFVLKSVSGILEPRSLAMFTAENSVCHKLKNKFYIFQVHFRADEWDVNKWAWEGVLKVISKGEECIIRLEDKTTGKIIFMLL
jgi:hypothetical protein